MRKGLWAAWRVLWTCDGVGSWKLQREACWERRKYRAKFFRGSSWKWRLIVRVVRDDHIHKGRIVELESRNQAS